MSDGCSFDGLIWDVDGTLADTQQLCVDVIRATIVHHGGPDLSPGEVTALYGPTENGVLRNVLGERWRPAAETFISKYGSRHDAEAAAFPGLREILQRLHKDGVPMAVVTGKGERSARITLDAFGLTAYFDPILGGSIDGPVKVDRIASVVAAWAVRPQRVGYVGDVVSDIEAARAAGVAAIAAAWKPGADVAFLEEARPDEILASILALEDWAEASVLG